MRPLSGQARLIQKNRQRNVAKYKRFSQYKRALRDHQQSPLLRTGGAAADETEATPEADLGADATGGGDDDGGSAHAAPLAKRKKKAKHLSAAAAARRRWEEQQAEVTAAREAAQAAREQRIREQDAARKRRSEQVIKLSKRTKRGQPVLGNHVERFLSKLQSGAL